MVDGIIEFFNIWDDFFPSCTINCWDTRSKASTFNCRFVSISFQFCQFLPYIFLRSVVWHECIRYYIFLMDWNLYSFFILYFQHNISLHFKWLSFREHTILVKFLIHCTNLHLLIDIFRPLTFNVIDLLELQSDILSFLLCLFSVPFTTFLGFLRVPWICFRIHIYLL